MKKFFPFRIPVLTLILALLVPAAFAQAAPEPTSATTPPPPIGFSILTVFDSNFDYLESGHAYIFDNGDKKVRIAGETTATIRTSTIGVQVTLQRWTGSVWIDVFHGGNETDSNAAYVYSSYSNVPVESGYYYRTQAYHWINEGSRTESGYRYSATYLVP